MPDLGVSNLTALVLIEELVTGRVGYYLSLVGQGVGDSAVLNGLDQLRNGSLPLGAAGTGVSTGHFPLGNSHSYLFSLVACISLLLVCIEQGRKCRPPGVDDLVVVLRVFL